MGMYAEILAIGPFSKEVARYLEYDPTYYAQTVEGVIVNMTLFGISEGSAVSRVLAKALGITDPWDFNQHKLSNGAIDCSALTDFAKCYCHYADDVEVMKALLKHNFEFHFAPNG